MDSTTSAKCASCGRQPSTKRCSACQTSFYCSTDCQRRDWKAGHKQRCKIISFTKDAQATAAKLICDSVKGVHLTCSEEPGGFWEVDIPSNHTMFDNPLLEVPALLEVPIVIYRVGTQSTSQSGLDCQIATYLNIKYVDGLAPPEWQSRVGSCLVARKDKKPLSSQHLEAVWMYIDRILDHFSEGARGAQQLITRQQFEGWLGIYSHNQVINGRTEWGNVGSLYDF